ncbi:MAG: hypothetical protein ACE5FN_09445 [Leptospirillia bacterium]
MRETPSFAEWLADLPWWAKLLIAAGTAFGIYVVIGPFLKA